jgi:ribosomal protein S18 acetylase RimI-like enzyme
LAFSSFTICILQFAICILHSDLLLRPAGCRMSSYQIRPFRPADREAILRLTVDSFGGVAIEKNAENLFGLINGKDWKWRKARQVDCELERDPGGAFVAEDQGKVVGYVTTYSDRESGVGYIPNLAVDSEQRGSGIGRALIERALEHFRQQGLANARIETLQQNPIGQHLYPSCGFREVARQIYYGLDLQSPSPGC